MALKTYSQNCGLAAALDVIGERWTLLIIRALLPGQTRFGEIRAQLPGIGTNLLAERLKLLERRGVIERLDGPKTGYALTAKGEALSPIVRQLAAWGRDYLPIAGAAQHPSWTMFNLEAAFRPERAEDVEAVVEFDIAGDRFHLVIRKQRCRGLPGPATAPDVSIRAEGNLLPGERTRLNIHGDADVFDRVRPCFAL
jgi:DNA-binding HxlR family transcriptional regulator